MAQGLRNIANSNRFPNDANDPSTNQPEEHYTGLIWGGALWDLRTALGAAVADKLAFGTLYFLPQNGTANFQLGLQALIATDNAQFGGAHVATIRQLLNTRGIFEPGSSTTTTPLTPGASKTGTIPVPNPGFCILGSNQYTIQVPPGTKSLTAELQGSGDVDLYVRKGSAVTVENARFVADYKSDSPNNTETVIINQSSTFFLYVARA